MDNLTHSLVGLFLARIGFRHATPRATAVLIVAANIPDIDAVSWLWGGAAYIHYHRNITHALVALPAMALLAVALVRLAGPLHWLYAWLVALPGVASHVVLDLTNIYGVRLLLPFSGRWFHQDITPVVDGAIFAIVALGVAAPFLVRLVGSEIGDRNQDAGKGGWALTALLLLFSYDYGRSLLHDRAVEILQSHTYNGLAARRVGAFPTANPLVWNGIAELSNAFVEAPVDLRDTFHPADEQTLAKPPRTAQVDAALPTLPFQRLLEFVQWPLWVVEPGRVSLVDLRFGSPRDALFAATATFDERGAFRESHFGLKK